MRRSKLGALACALGLFAAGLLWLYLAPSRDEQSPVEQKARLGLMTTLPIYWGEGAEFGDLLKEDQAPHWVRQLLELDYELVPLDSLAADGAAVPSPQLASLDRLALMQPRPLAPAEFAALDQWVNEGGELLLFADPLLTEHSEFALGDRRRPQAIALLSPIFARWGLTQFFDDNQPTGPQPVTYLDVAIPVDQAGYFENAGAENAQCSLQAEGLIADCAIGEGSALIVSDAALLDGGSGNEGAKLAVQSLFMAAFDSK